MKIKISCDAAQSVTLKQTNFQPREHIYDYITHAPLLTMTYASVNGVARLIGVFTCAPGFSFPVSDITGAGALDVEEDFNISGLTPAKLLSLNLGESSYLYDLHGMQYDSYNHSVWPGQILRIGETLLDDVGDDHKQLRDGGFPYRAADPTTEQEFKTYPGDYYMMARYSDTQLLVLKDTEELTLLDITQ